MEVMKPGLGCKLAPLVPKGTKLTDVRQKHWIVGKPVGAGAFGAIYLARRPGGEEEYVVKVEPHTNGPLFVEMHAFLRLGLESQRSNWNPRNSRHQQGWVGVPLYYGSGSFTLGDEMLRFLVMSRLGSDIQKFFQSGEKPLPLTTALNIGVQILECLEFIHSRNYCHNDIKAQNVLLGYGQEQDRVYLVDFGLACKYRDMAGFHRDSTPDERRAHEGTLEYASRDAHTGVHSRRGDLETLGYNLVHWVSGYLPWTKSEDQEYVQAQKIGYMYNIPEFLRRCFKPHPTPGVLEDYLVYTNSLEFHQAPDYSRLRKLLSQAMRKTGVEPYSPLVFSNKRRPDREESSDEEDFGQEETRNTRSQDDDTRFAPWSWEQVLSLDPESIIRQASRSSENLQSEEDSLKTAAFNQQQVESLGNPTPEMRRLIEARERLEEQRQKLSWKDQLAEYNQRNAALKAKFSSLDLTLSELTPAMEEVIARRAERLASGVGSPMTPEPSEDEAEEPEVNTVLRNSGRRRRRSASTTPTFKSASTTPTSKSASTTPRTRNDPTTPSSRPATPRSRRRSSNSSFGQGSSTSHSVSGSRTSSNLGGRITRSGTSSRASTPEYSVVTRCTRSRSATQSPVEATEAANTYDEADTGRDLRRSNPAGLQGEFKEPNEQVKVVCDLRGRRLYQRSLKRHLDTIHADQPSQASQRAALTKRVVPPGSPRTPVLLLKRARDQRHHTPLVNQEQEVVPRLSRLLSARARAEAQGSARKLEEKREEEEDDEEGQEAGALQPLCLTRKMTTRRRKTETGESVTHVHVSVESPCKIRNLDSLEKASSAGSVASPLVSVSETVKLRRGLKF